LQAFPAGKAGLTEFSAKPHRGRGTANTDAVFSELSGLINQYFEYRSFPRSRTLKQKAAHLMIYSA